MENLSQLEAQLLDWPEHNKSTKALLGELEILIEQQAVVKEASQEECEKLFQTGNIRGDVIAKGLSHEVDMKKLLLERKAYAEDLLSKVPEPQDVQYIERTLMKDLRGTTLAAYLLRDSVTHPAEKQSDNTKQLETDIVKTLGSWLKHNLAVASRTYRPSPDAKTAREVYIEDIIKQYDSRLHSLTESKEEGARESVAFVSKGDICFLCRSIIYKYSTGRLMNRLLNRIDIALPSLSTNIFYAASDMAAPSMEAYPWESKGALRPVLLTDQDTVIEAIQLLVDKCTEGQESYQSFTFSPRALYSQLFDVHTRVMGLIQGKEKGNQQRSPEAGDLCTDDDIDWGNLNFVRDEPIPDDIQPNAECSKQDNGLPPDLSRPFVQDEIVMAEIKFLDLDDVNKVLDKLIEKARDHHRHLNWHDEERLQAVGRRPGTSGSGRPGTSGRGQSPYHALNRGSRGPPSRVSMTSGSEWDNQSKKMSDQAPKGLYQLEDFYILRSTWIRKLRLRLLFALNGQIAVMQCLSSDRKKLQRHGPFVKTSQYVGVLVSWDQDAPTFYKGAFEARERVDNRVIALVTDILNSWRRVTPVDGAEIDRLTLLQNIYEKELELAEAKQKLMQEYIQIYCNLVDVEGKSVIEREITSILNRFPVLIGGHLDFEYLYQMLIDGLTMEGELVGSIVSTTVEVEHSELSDIHRRMGNFRGKHVITGLPAPPVASARLSYEMGYDIYNSISLMVLLPGLLRNVSSRIQENFSVSNPCIALAIRSAVMKSALEQWTSLVRDEISLECKGDDDDMRERVVIKGDNITSDPVVLDNLLTQNIGGVDLDNPIKFSNADLGVRMLRFVSFLCSVQTSKYEAAVLAAAYTKQANAMGMRVHDVIFPPLDFENNKLTPSSFNVLEEDRSDFTVTDISSLIERYSLDDFAGTEWQPNWFNSRQVTSLTDWDRFLGEERLHELAHAELMQELHVWAYRVAVDHNMLLVTAVEKLHLKNQASLSMKRWLSQLAGGDGEESMALLDMGVTKQYTTLYETDVKSLYRKRSRLSGMALNLWLSPSKLKYKARGSALRSVAKTSSKRPQDGMEASMERAAFGVYYQSVVTDLRIAAFKMQAAYSSRSLLKVIVPIIRLQGACEPFLGVKSSTKSVWRAYQDSIYIFDPLFYTENQDDTDSTRLGLVSEKKLSLVDADGKINPWNLVTPLEILATANHLPTLRAACAMFASLADICHAKYSLMLLESKVHRKDNSLSLLKHQPHEYFRHLVTYKTASNRNVRNSPNMEAACEYLQEERLALARELALALDFSVVDFFKSGRLSASSHAAQLCSLLLSSSSKSTKAQPDVTFMMPMSELRQTPHTHALGRIFGQLPCTALAFGTSLEDERAIFKGIKGDVQNMIKKVLQDVEVNAIEHPHKVSQVTKYLIRSLRLHTTLTNNFLEHERGSQAVTGGEEQEHESLERQNAHALSEFNNRIVKPAADVVNGIESIPSLMLSTARTISSDFQKLRLVEAQTYLLKADCDDRWLRQKRSDLQNRVKSGIYAQYGDPSNSQTFSLSDSNAFIANALSAFAELVKGQLVAGDGSYRVTRRVLGQWLFDMLNGLDTEIARRLLLQTGIREEKADIQLDAYESLVKQNEKKCFEYESTIEKLTVMKDIDVARTSQQLLIENGQLRRKVHTREAELEHLRLIMTKEFEEKHAKEISELKKEIMNLKSKKTLRQDDMKDSVNSLLGDIRKEAIMKIVDRVEAATGDISSDLRSVVEAEERNALLQDECANLKDSLLKLRTLHRLQVMSRDKRYQDVMSIHEYEREKRDRELHDMRDTMKGQIQLLDGELSTTRTALQASKKLVQELRSEIGLLERSREKLLQWKVQKTREDNGKSPFHTMKAASLKRESITDATPLGETLHHHHQQSLVDDDNVGNNKSHGDDEYRPVSAPAHRVGGLRGKIEKQAFAASCVKDRRQRFNDLSEVRQLNLQLQRERDAKEALEMKVDRLTSRPGTPQSSGPRLNETFMNTDFDQATLNASLTNDAYKTKFLNLKEKYRVEQKRTEQLSGALQMMSTLVSNIKEVEKNEILNAHALKVKNPSTTTSTKALPSRSHTSARSNANIPRYRSTNNRPASQPPRPKSAAPSDKSLQVKRNILHSHRPASALPASKPVDEPNIIMRLTQTSWLNNSSS